MDLPAHHKLALADIVWWMKGARAFVRSRRDRAILQGMHDKAQQVREWIDDLGHNRRYVCKDERDGNEVFAITLAEFERMMDGLRPDATERDAQDGYAAVQEIWSDIKQEAKLPNPGDYIPF